MTTQEMVMNVLQEKGTLSAFEIKGFVYRKFGVNISSQSAAGALRTPIAQGKVARGQTADHKTIYWLRKDW